MSHLRCGQEEHRRQCSSQMLHSIEYFASQDAFLEGSEKVVTIDVTPFFDGCTASIKDLVEYSLLIVFGPQKYPATLTKQDLSGKSISKH